jgi:hypothetical protein
MRFEVRVAELLAARIVEFFGEERSVDGRPSEADFWSGPLAAALLGFRAFDSLRFDDGPSIRWLTLSDPVFGPVTFVGALVGDGVVEIAGFDFDPDYWDLIRGDPDDV